MMNKIYERISKLYKRFYLFISQFALIHRRSKMLIFRIEQHL